MIHTLKRLWSVGCLEEIHGLLLEQYKYSCTVKPAFSAFSSFRFCTQVWSGNCHSHTRKQPLSQSYPASLSNLFQCHLFWPLTELHPSELPNKIQGGSSEKLYKISFLKLSTEWKPWASFWRINTLCILNKENGLCD